MAATFRRFPFQVAERFCEIQFPDESRIVARKKLRNMLGEIDRIAMKYSLSHRDNFVSEINAMAGNNLGIKIDMETRSLFDHVKQSYEHSDGLVDITVGPLRELWNFDSDETPDQNEIDRRLPLVGFDKLEWHRSRLIMPENLAIDFGDLVLEYAADTIADMAGVMVIESGLINLGGSFSVIGPLPNERPWPVGIIYGDEAESKMAKLMLPKGGLASRGDYQNAFVHQGKKYSRVINPKTGWPFNGLQAVSVTADSCALAGYAADVAMTKPETEAIEWLAELGVDHAYLTLDGELGGQGVTLGTTETETG